MTTSPQDFQGDRLPASDGLTVNRAAKRCQLSREDMQAMIGVLERHAGLLPREQDAQGQLRRVISERLLLPHFETAAYVMRVEGLTATEAMEATLSLGVNYCLPRLSRIVMYLDGLKGMPHGLRDAAREIQDATRRLPSRIEVSILDQEDVRQELERLQRMVRGSQIGQVALAVLMVLVVLMIR